MQDLDFRTLVGHGAALQALRKGGRREPFPSLIFDGPARIGKRLTGIWYAAFLNCLQKDDLAPCGQCSACKKLASGGHPDLHCTRVPEKKTVVGVSEVREIINEIHHAPFEGNFRVWIIEEGERLSDEAQNALLKTLEEPPRRAVILLVTNLVGTLLPTVFSRCRLVRFGGLEPGQMLEALRSQGADQAMADKLTALCGGSLGLALTLLREPGVLEEQENVLELFGGLPGQDLWAAVEAARLLERSKHTSPDALIGLGLSFFRDLLMLSAGSPELVVHKSRLAQFEQLASQISTSEIRALIKEFQEADLYLQRNVSPRLLFQRLCVNVSRSL
ncbi:MAG: hypothetical protein WC314_03245 [Vulcanimicrobiota bacterium]